MKERILYLDNLKVIAIFCVVYTHFILLGTGWLDHFTDVITYIGCPIFFMVNGALVLNREGFNLKNHLRKILHIYLVFGCWKFIMVFVCEVVFHEPLFPWQSARGVFKLYGRIPDNVSSDGSFLVSGSVVANLLDCSFDKKCI